MRGDDLQKHIKFLRALFMVAYLLSVSWGKNCELLEGAYVNYSGLHFVIVNLLVQFKFHFEQCLKEPHYNFLVPFAILVFLT